MYEMSDDWDISHQFRDDNTGSIFFEECWTINELEERYTVAEEHVVGVVQRYSISETDLVSTAQGLPISTLEAGEPAWAVWFTERIDIDTLCVPYHLRIHCRHSDPDIEYNEDMLWGIGGA